MNEDKQHKQHTQHKHQSSAMNGGVHHNINHLNG
jgi:hypothetical protein